MLKSRFLRRRQRPVARASSCLDGLNRRSLIHHHEFRNLWAAESVSQFGTQISVVALPLIAALALDASAFEMGLLAAAATTPILLFGLIVGVWVDRLPRRQLLMVADVARAMLLFLIPAAWAFDMVSIELLYGVAFMVGVRLMAAAEFASNVRAPEESTCIHPNGSGVRINSNRRATKGQSHIMRVGSGCLWHID